MADMAVASFAACSLSNRLSALAGVVLLTAGVGLIELSDFIIKSGLRVDTLVVVALVNTVDLDAVIDGAFVAFITCFV